MKFTATRHDDGNLTRAGMVAIIARGESVMFPGSEEPITSVEDLPPEEVIAAGSVQRLERLRESQEEAARRSQEALDRTNAAIEKARTKPAPAAPPTKDQPPAGKPDAGKLDAPKK